VLQNQYKAEVRQRRINLLQAENQLKTVELIAVKNQGLVTIVISIFALVILLLTVNHHIRKEKMRLTRHNKTIRANKKQLILLSIAFKNIANAVWISNKDFEIAVVKMLRHSYTQTKV
jgi:hypothetical protein